MTQAVVVVVSATRLTQERFWAESALGHSLRRMAFDVRLQPRIACSNAQGLPTLYNQAIQAAPAGSHLVFVHDDVWLDDYFFATRVLEGLAQYDVIGVAGNRRRVPHQPAWAFVDNRFTWDERTHLSGSVGHGKMPFGAVSHFGPAPADCELLDGVLIAARRDGLIDKQAFFDEQFRFHFYDLDFCRTARARGLRLGTWPIALTHQSGGAFGTPDWQANHQRYLAKWPD